MWMSQRRERGLTTRLTDFGDEKMADDGTDSTDRGPYWVEWFSSLRGNEFFCDVDEDYILDKFNLTGLANDVTFYPQALDVIVDAVEAEEIGEDDRAAIERSARHLYGLIHARFILTARGLAKMRDLYVAETFGRCPRHLCNGHPVLPIGLLDVPRMKCVKLYCPHCEDVYDPPRKYAAIDGSYFGSTFPHLFLQTYPPASMERSYTLYKPKVFGFRVHQYSEEHHFQESLLKDMIARLKHYEEEESAIENRRKELVNSLAQIQEAADKDNNNNDDNDQDNEQNEGGSRITRYFTAAFAD